MGFNKHLQKRRIFLFFRDWSVPPVLTFGKHPKVETKYQTFHETNLSLLDQKSKLGRVDFYNQLNPISNKFSPEYG